MQWDLARFLLVGAKNNRRNRPPQKLGILPIGNWVELPILAADAVAKALPALPRLLK